MEPRIQYAKTSDGVNIAYAVFGTEPAIVFAGGAWGDIHMYRSGAGGGNNRPYDELVSLGCSVITYDGRGAGSSDRDVEDYTLEGRTRDLDAVVNRVAPDRFALCGVNQGGLASVAYAVQHSDRLTHLVLCNAFANAREYYEIIPAMRMSQQTLRDAEHEWEFATLTLANAITGYSDSERARRLAEAFRTGMTPQGYIAFRNAAEEIDVRHLLPQIGVPTLVVYDRSSLIERLGILVQRLTPHIPNARFIETPDLARAIDEFLREDGPTAEPSLPSGTAIILFADIADSTGLTERMGDSAFREKARELDGALRAAIRERGGTPIEGKLLGDGVLAVFTSAREAIEAAVRCRDEGNREGLPLHLGIHAGDVIRERDADGRDNVYGGAVNIASRIAGLSAAGEVLVSETVRSLARTSAGVGFEDRGEQALKGVGERVRVWAVAAAANQQTGKPANQGGA
jgi:class 3 adenylate cyclase/alpha-beta hydrolase superfamily lysophospholipase